MARLSAGRARRRRGDRLAGNHAQGVALAARKLGLTATIVMPRHHAEHQGGRGARARAGQKPCCTATPYDEAAAHALELVAQKGLSLVHPYDDPDVIAGQGTIAREILEQLHQQPLDAWCSCRSAAAA